MRFDNNAKVVYQTGGGGNSTTKHSHGGKEKKFGHNLIMRSPSQVFTDYTPSPIQLANNSNRPSSNSVVKFGKINQVINIDQSGNQKVSYHKVADESGGGGGGYLTTPNIKLQNRLHSDFSVTNNRTTPGSRTTQAAGLQTSSPSVLKYKLDDSTGQLQPTNE